MAMCVRSPQRTLAYRLLHEGSMRAFRIGILLALLALPAAFAQVNDTYIIPAAANTPGDFGTHWKTQFSLFNPQSYDLNVSITLVPTGGTQALTKNVDVPANATALSDDIIQDLYKRTNLTGALLVATFPEDNPGVPDDVISRSFLVTSDTYNDARSGTYGQTIPGIWTGLQDYATDGISAIAHGVRNLAAQGWRANIGAVNLGRADVTMRVTVYDADGNIVQSNIPMGIPPLAHFQQRLPVEVDAGAIEFFIDDPLANDPNNSAVVFPYVSVADDLSGDPKYQSPVLLASPSVLFKQGGQAAQIGKKIDISTARRVRDGAVRLGTATLKTAAR